jgi:hypothetical protein
MALTRFHCTVYGSTVQQKTIDPLLAHVPVNTFSVYSPKLACMSRYTKAKHSVYMRFERRQRWHVSFSEAGLETELPRKLTFRSSGKILELARRGEALGTLEDRQVLERAMDGRPKGVLSDDDARAGRGKRLRD